MFEITVNNRVIDAEEGETILSALTRVGIRVPTLCHLPDLPPMGACRICIVEVEGAEGDGLVPSCSYPVAEGMRIFTNSRKVINARRTLLELLLSNHPDDCLYCQKSRDCSLRTLAEEYGVRERTPGKRFREKLRDLTGACVVRDASKCILCGKCVRVCEEVQKVSAIGFVGRAGRTVVAPAFHQSMNVSSCVGCGQCTLVCPTGALVEHSSLDSVTAAVGDPEKCVVIQHSPAVVLAVAEEFGLKPGMDVPGLLNAALRRIGFRKVFNSAFAADIAIQEQSKELVERLKSGANLPLIAACSVYRGILSGVHPESFNGAERTGHSCIADPHAFCESGRDSARPDFLCCRRALYRAEIRGRTRGSRRRSGAGCGFDFARASAPDPSLWNRLQFSYS